MTEVKKSGSSRVVRSASPEDMEKINRLALVELAAEDVFTFDVIACDNQVDRDGEQFSDAALDKLAKLFVGKTVIFDHQWSAGNQTARIYDATVSEKASGLRQLRVSVYMLANDSTAALREAICGGILREVSVGCAVSKLTCSVCGTDYCTCGHRKGDSYDGVLCVVVLDEPTDAYELSFVAVPAQRGAGVTKAAGVTMCKSDGELDPPPGEAPDNNERAKQLAQAKARVDLMDKITKI